MASSNPTCTPHDLVTLIILTHYLHTLSTTTTTASPAQANTLTLLCIDLLDSKKNVQTSTLIEYLKCIRASPHLQSHPTLSQQLCIYINDTYTTVLTSVDAVDTYIRDLYTDVLIDSKVNTEAPDAIYTHKIERNSIFGQFIRRTIISLYTSASTEFAGIVQLYEALQLYCNCADTNAQNASATNDVGDELNTVFAKLQQSRKQRNLGQSIQYIALYHDALQQQQNGAHHTDKTGSISLTDVQYNVLHLCELQTQYNYYPLAIQSLIECIALAQQYNDQTCLMYALNTLIYIAIQLNDTSIAQQCIQTSLNTSAKLRDEIAAYHMHRMNQTQNANQTQQTQIQLPTAVPVPVLDAMSAALSARLALTCGDQHQSASGGTLSNRATRVAHSLMQSNAICVNNELHDQYVVNQLVDAYAYNMYGQTTQSELTNQLVLRSAQHSSKSVQPEHIVNALLNQCMSTNVSFEQKLRVVEHITAEYATHLTYTHKLQLLFVQFHAQYERADIAACNKLYQQCTDSICLHHTELTYNSAVYIEYCLIRCQNNLLNGNMDVALNELLDLCTVCDQPHLSVVHIDVLSTLIDVYMEQQCAVQCITTIHQAIALCLPIQAYGRLAVLYVELAWVQLYVLAAPAHALSVLSEWYTYVLQHGGIVVRECAVDMMKVCYEQLGGGE